MPVIQVRDPEGNHVTVCLEAQCAISGGRLFGFSACSRREDNNPTQNLPGLHAMEWTGECFAVTCLQHCIMVSMRSGNVMFSACFAGDISLSLNCRNSGYEAAGKFISVRMRSFIRKQRFTARRLVLAMGLHWRLGANSSLSVFAGEPALLDIIVYNMA